MKARNGTSQQLHPAQIGESLIALEIPDNIKVLLVEHKALSRNDYVTFGILAIICGICLLLPISPEITLIVMGLSAILLSPSKENE